MTERHPDDEALSAVLDGEGGDDDRIHVDGCAPCQARLAQFRGVSLAVGAAVPARADSEISAAVSRALAAAGASGGSGATRAAWAPAGRSAGRRRPNRTPPKAARLAAIAAIVVIVAGITSVIAVTSHHSRAKESSAASATIPRVAGAAGAAASAAAASGSTTTPPGGGPPSTPAPRTPSAASPALGNQSDPTVLAAALRAMEKDGSAGDAATFLSPPACTEPAASGAGLDPSSRPLLVAPLTWKGQDAQVLVFAVSGPTTSQRAVVVDADSCAVLVSFTL
jgi:hypothetical protein